jgi:hypothetical protein
MLKVSTLRSTSIGLVIASEAVDIALTVALKHLEVRMGAYQVINVGLLKVDVLPVLLLNGRNELADSSDGGHCCMRVCMDMCLGQPGMDGGGSFKFLAVYPVYKTKIF